jgi:hypothetical protein
MAIKNILLKNISQRMLQVYFSAFFRLFEPHIFKLGVENIIIVVL